MGDAGTRNELTGLPGIAETALSDALVATLPQNLAPAPWECHCSALIWVTRGGAAASAVLPPALAGSAALVTVGGFVRYTDTPVGPYDEVLGMVGTWTGLFPSVNVALMAVDSQASLVGGRSNWAMPKTLARFDGDVSAGSTMTGTGAGPMPWSVSATSWSIGPAIPYRTRTRARQQFADGRVGDSVLTFAGRVRLAVVTTEVSSEGTLARWLRPGRHLGALIENATFTLGEPKFR